MWGCAEVRGHFFYLGNKNKKMFFILYFAHLLVTLAQNI